MPAPEPIIVLRIVAAPHALDAVSVSPRPAMRLAPDELWVVGDTRPVIDDPHAIVFRDTGHVCLTWSEAMAAAILDRACEWERPVDRPAFAQGAVAGLPVKLWFDGDRVLCLVPSAFAMDAEARLR